MACSQCGQVVGSLVLCDGISGVFKIMNAWVHQEHSGSALFIHKEQRGPLSVQHLIIICSCNIPFPAFGAR